MRFRQDLRVDDNTALWHAVSESVEIVSIFIFDTTILKFFSQWQERIGFLIDAVESLEKKLQSVWWSLHIFHGDPSELVPLLIKKYKIRALYCNKSYGLGSKTRDMNIKKRCYAHTISMHTYTDYLLVDPDQIPTRKVYTPFYRLRKAKVEKDLLHQYHIRRINSPIIEHDGRKKVKANVSHKKNNYRSVGSMSNYLQDIDTKEYDQKRNDLSSNSTTKLSPYIRFWILSIRQVYSHFAQQDGLGAEAIVKELAWREFRYHIAHYYPETAQIAFQEKRRHIQRENNEQLFKMRKEWRTGYPIVDAAMRQLKEENRMHWRARMIVASFLTKDLMIDRTRGEKYFSDHLLDYDRAVNIGNWQWSASVWADPKPLRIFNPILQSKKFDPETTYIKKYLPELALQPTTAIHDPINYKLEYYEPIVNHYTNSLLAKKMYHESARNQIL